MSGPRRKAPVPIRRQIAETLHAVFRDQEKSGRVEEDREAFLKLEREQKESDRPALIWSYDTLVARRKGLEVPEVQCPERGASGGPDSGEMEG